MREIKILSAEIYDNAVKDEEGYYMPSEVSVLVNFEIKEKEYFLDFQTTDTFDYGAYSSDLRAYDGTDDYDALREICNDDEEFCELLDEIKKQSNAQQKWREYIEENYNVDTRHYGGMDANSEINKMTKKE